MADNKEKNTEAQEEVKKEKKPAHARKTCKVSHMTLQQIEEALAETEKKMGGLESSHARFLLAQKHFLVSTQRVGKPTLRKAA